MPSKSSYPVVAAALISLALASLISAAERKGPSFSIEDDPSSKVGSPKLVLIAVSDFQ